MDRRTEIRGAGKKTVTGRTNKETEISMNGRENRE